MHLDRSIKLQRVWVEVSSVTTWYQVIHEANTLYGKNWKGQPRVKRRLENNWAKRSLSIWFDVPDAAFASWISVKHGVIAQLKVNK